jgi:hypothetical protein
VRATLDLLAVQPHLDPGRTKSLDNAQHRRPVAAGIADENVRR